MTFIFFALNFVFVCFCDAEGSFFCVTFSLYIFRWCCSAYDVGTFSLFFSFSRNYYSFCSSGKDEGMAVEQFHCKNLFIRRIGPWNVWIWFRFRCFCSFSFWINLCGELCTQKAKTNINVFSLSLFFPHIWFGFFHLWRGIFDVEMRLRHRSNISSQSNARFVSVQTSVCSVECFKYFNIVCMRASRWQKYAEQTKDKRIRTDSCILCAPDVSVLYYICQRTLCIYCKCVLSHWQSVQCKFILFIFFVSLGLRIVEAENRLRIILIELIRSQCTVEPEAGPEPTTPMLIHSKWSNKDHRWPLIIDIASKRSISTKGMTIIIIWDHSFFFFYMFCEKQFKRKTV